MLQKRTLAAIITITSVLLLDQAIKFWVKTHMVIGDEITITSWFRIHFIENEGMAFGWKLGGNWGKLLLSLFRIVAVGFIGYYLMTLIRKKAHPGLIITMSMILAGAIGNILDSIFYGVIFSESNFELAKFLPTGGGYASFLHGRVVDMLWFPLWEGFLPQWIPVWGGKYFMFFEPVFNIADSSISVGVFLILIFQTVFFAEPKTENKELSTDGVSG